MCYLERASSIRESGVSTEADSLTNDSRECLSVSCDRIAEVARSSIESLQFLYGRVQSFFETSCCSVPREHGGANYRYMTVKYGLYARRDPSSVHYLDLVYRRF